ncbi:right-handed parallel beta-helix repeat-containing protein [Clostridium sp. LP20]|uniref:right-handed parallel beta-helix repeat-containing protein n=1 Tax=Clostridium sp. LP20 TaxID=3418665 RepID=UPI003EE7EE7D
MRLKNNLSLLSSIILLCALLPIYPISAVTNEEESVLRTIYCSSADEIQNALRSAEAGDRIIIKEGSYVGKWMEKGYFTSNAQGTKEHPITIESENLNNPSELVGLRSSSGYALYLTGDYWRVSNLKITNAQKGIMIDNGNYNIISGCQVYAVEQEGIHLRDGSSNNIIKNTKVYDTGTVRPDYGEGIYIGSDKGKWSELKKECDNNIITNCEIGPNVGAEHLDIKEGTTGTVIEDCIFNGEGISGKNYADSFIDVKGNKTVVRNNIGYRNKNLIIVDAFQIHVQVDGWGLDNEFYDNHLYLDIAEVNILNNSKGTATVYNNKRYPDGNMYIGNNKVLDFKVEDLNRDGVVDLMDLSLVSKEYNKTSDINGFSRSSDLNNDGIIDIYDLVLISKSINI